MIFNPVRPILLHLHRENSGSHVTQTSWPDSFWNMQGYGSGSIASVCKSLFDLKLRIRAMHEANTALLDILIDNSVIIPSF